MNRIIRSLDEARSILTDDELTHWGVKGMKWGVRRNRKGAQTASTDSTGKKVIPTDKWGQSTKKTENVKYARAFEKVGKMSDAELQARVKRIKLEKQYKELVEGDKAILKAGLSAAKEIFVNVSSSYLSDKVQNAGNSYGTAAAKMTVEQVFKALPNSRKAIGR